MPEAELRREQVKQVVEDFVRTFGNCRVLVTSRTYAYQNQGWRLQGFAEVVLAPFSDGQIRRFISRWYELTAGLERMSAQDATGRAESLKRAIFSRPMLYELAQRPLLLTLMASLHAWRRGDLPEKRELLYHDTVDLLLNRWERRFIKEDTEGRPRSSQPSIAEYLKADKTKIRTVLEDLAFEAHRAQPELTGTADLSEDILAGRLLRLSGNPDANIGRLVEYLRDRAGLLYPRGVGVYTFPHRSFQEYLAACHLTGATYPDEVAKLALDDPDRWREVALLAGAKAARGAVAGIWNLAHALCYLAPDDPRVSEQDVWGAQIAAQALIESADLSLDFDNQPRLDEIRVRVRTWLARLLRSERLPATERALAGNNLAVLGDPRFDPERWYLPDEPLLGFIEIPAGKFTMGSDEERLWGDEQRRHPLSLPRYFMARWPVTVVQFTAFVEASGFTPRAPDALRDVANHPVVWVSWHEAVAYCRWLHERLRELAPTRLSGAQSLSEAERSFWQGLAEGSLSIGLPSEAEWEKAARGTDGRIYPWGEKPDPERANYNETGINGTTAVGCFPGGASPYGCEEMSGNVWEWTSNHFDQGSHQPDNYHTRVSVNGQYKREHSDISVVRGGSWESTQVDTRCIYRSKNPQDSRSWSLGFRCCLRQYARSSYQLVVNILQDVITVGQIISLHAEVLPSMLRKDVFNLPDDILEVHCFISAEGFSVQGSDVVTMPLDPQRGQPLSASFELQAELPGTWPYTVDLFIENPDSGQVRLFQTQGQLTVHLSPVKFTPSPPLPSWDVRVAPSPDWVLQVTTTLPEGTEGSHHLTYFLSSRLPELRWHNQPVGTVLLSPADLRQFRALVLETLRAITGIQPEDARARMRSVGIYLFDRLFPTETAGAFRQALWQAAERLTTWLIIEDGVTWLPWELVAPYQEEDDAPIRFLSERYQLGRWVAGLGPPLHHEIPLGEIALAHYKLLTPAQAAADEELRAWGRLLNIPEIHQGIIAIVNPDKPFYGLHLLRHADEIASRREIVAKTQRDPTAPVSPEEEVPKARLDLRLKRPVVTLSMLSRDGPPHSLSTDEWPLPERLLPFLRAGASAVVGPWWPTCEAADRIFWPCFYDLLERRLPVGEAVWRARLAVARALPHRLDWLAYTLFGDPRARPYWPEASEGYTTLECLNPDEPLRPGKTYTFRATLRARPPTWHQERLVQVDRLPDEAKALFIAPGLLANVPEIVTMSPAGRTIRQAIISITPPRSGSYPLLVELVEGNRHLETLQLILNVGDEASAG
ncbi:MAG: SUMF1/EgtB/PvdO family nonheme iron enzyme [Candidatus Competibacteraceae bacterium]